MKLSQAGTKTGLLILLLSTGCATAYRDNAAEEQPVEVALSDEALDDQFTSEQLSEARLRAMETGARQKLQDFVDYLNIAGNPALDSTFRQEAVRQTERLFTNPQATIDLSLDPTTGGARSMSGWLKILSRSRAQKTFAVEHLAISQPLTADGRLQYRGTLSFSLSHGDTKASQQADILVKKVYKEFGREKEWVWEMFLGDIR